MLVSKRAVVRGHRAANGSEGHDRCINGRIVTWTTAADGYTRSRQPGKRIVEAGRWYSFELCRKQAHMGESPSTSGGWTWPRSMGSEIELRGTAR